MEHDDIERTEATGGTGGWQRKVLGWGALGVASVLLAVLANLSEIAGWFAPDETRVLVEETRGAIQNTDNKVNELLTLLRNQAAASGVDLDIGSEAAIRNAIAAIVASGNARKQAALEHLDNGDVAGAASLLSTLAANQADAVDQTSAAAAVSSREAGALYYMFDVTQAISAYETAHRLEPGNAETLEMLGYSLNRAGRLDEATARFEELLRLDAGPAAEVAARLGLGAIAKQRGHYKEAGAQLRLALGVAESAALRADRIHALLALAQLNMSQGKPGDADVLLREALPLAAEYDDAKLEARVLDARGTIAARQQRYGEAEELLQRALAIHDARNDIAGRARSLGNLGAVALLQGDVDVAETMIEETVVLGEQLGWQSSVAYDLVNLGAIASARRDFALADERLARAQQIAETIGLNELAPVIVFNRGEIAHEAGDVATACGYWLTALPALQAMGSEHVVTAQTRISEAQCLAGGGPGD